jgi:hypothetical protein
VNATRLAYLDKYRHALASMPPPGRGCHPHLLRVANYGVLARVHPQRIALDIRGAIPTGNRHVPNSEIDSAISTAVRDLGQVQPTRFRMPAEPPWTKPEDMLSIVQAGRESLRKSGPRPSPAPLSGNPGPDAQLLLERLYHPDEMLFIGECREPGVPGRSIRSAREWSSLVGKGYPLGPHVIPNPLSGGAVELASGKRSYRADRCVRSFRFATVEFDNLALEDQQAFWEAIQLPVAAIIHSGGKSLHGWVRVDSKNQEEWEAKVEQGLFRRFLVPLGVDPACRNESRLSRMPGFLRRETGNVQQLLYLDPSAGRSQP